MAAPQARISVGDDGVLNQVLTEDLSEIWVDRDLGWLDFNERVLAEALDERTPLLERVKFLAIFSSNLDEFFMKRIAVLREKLTPERVELLNRIREKLLPALCCQAECFRNIVLPGLASHGIVLARWDELSNEQQEQASQFFDEQVSPALTPLVIDSGHAFPFLSNLSTSLVFPVRDHGRRETRYGRVKVPRVLRQWIALPGKDPTGKVLVPLHEIIRGNLQKLYLGMELGEVTLFRLTRDAEVELDEESEEAPLPELVQEQVRQRRYEPVVRLEFAPVAAPAVKELLCQRFQLQDIDVYNAPAELDYTTLFEIACMDIPSLRDRPWTPLAAPPFADSEDDLFAAIAKPTCWFIILTTASTPASSGLLRTQRTTLRR